MAMFPPPPQELAPPPRASTAPPFSQLFITVLFVALAFTAGWVGNGLVNRDAPTPSSAKPWDKDIWAAWNAIDTQYWNPQAIDHQKMTYAAIAAMVDSLGDTGHSVALTPAAAQQENQSLSNAGFVGIGVYITQKTTSAGTAIVVQAAIPDSPAAQYLLPGDRFVSVNGTDVTNASLDTFNTLVRGKEGTSVTVVISRASSKTPLSFTITRKKITPKLVTSVYFPEDHIGYIHFDIFADGVAQEMQTNLKALQAEGATSLILDLRDNGGGLVTGAIGVASDFLQPGQTVFNEKDRNGKITANKVDSDAAAPKGLHLTLPMAILVNANTASASEITTTGIIGNRPDVQVIGERTYGTETVLLPFQLPSGAQLTLGVSQWLTPSLTHLAPGAGLTPTKTITLPAGAVAQSPLIIKQLKLSETDVLNCKGLNPDPQLIAGIQSLNAARVSTCATK
ncbi:MAG: PDZ domain-containing protein [Ktedonobacterales bacterium]|nr:PDZ domain-containing protein [Ktedonobacterales bacterium]